MLDKTKLYLMRAYKGEILSYHKTLRYIATINNHHLFADLIDKAGIVKVHVNSFPEWEEEGNKKFLITLG